MTMVSGPHLDAAFSAPEPRVPRPRLPLTARLVLGVAAFVTFALAVAWLVPTRLVDPRPGLITAGGGIGQSVTVSDDTAVVEIRLVQAEWLPAPGGDDRLRIGLIAQGLWGTTNLTSSQFLIQDHRGLLHGAESPRRPDAWVQSFISGGAVVQGTVDYLLPRQDLDLAVYAKTTEVLTTLAVPARRGAAAVVPRPVNPVYGLGQSVRVQLGTATAVVRPVSAEWSERRGERLLTVTVQVTVEQSTVWITGDWWSLADRVGDRHPALTSRWLDPGRSRDGIPVVEPGQTISGRLTFATPDRSGLLTVRSPNGPDAVFRL